MTRAMTSLVNKQTLIEYRNLKFLIMDAPSDSTIELYIKNMKQNRVNVLVRACALTYDCNKVTEAGIRYYPLQFEDGNCPPPDIIEKWGRLVKDTFEKHDRCIAVHCVAGLGRAPILIAIALIDAGMQPLDCVAFLRERRKGVLNNKQIQWLEKYKQRNERCLII